MTPINFTGFFSSEPIRFKELVGSLHANGYVTDENFGVSRCIFESISPEEFDEIFQLHFPGDEHEMIVQSTAFRRDEGPYVYVLYDTVLFKTHKQIGDKMRSDGVLDSE